MCVKIALIYTFKFSNRKNIIYLYSNYSNYNIIIITIITLISFWAMVII